MLQSYSYVLGCSPYHLKAVSVDMDMITWCSRYLTRLSL
jgi:hypothetical protein